MKEEDDSVHPQGEHRSVGQSGSGDMKAALAELVDAVAEQRQKHAATEKRSWLGAITAVLLFVLVAVVLIAGWYLYQERALSSSSRESDLKQQLTEIKSDLTLQQNRLASLQDDYSLLVQQNQKLQRDLLGEKGSSAQAREEVIKSTLERNQLQQRIILLEEENRESIVRLKASVASEQGLIKEQLDYKSQQDQLNQLLRVTQTELAAEVKKNQNAVILIDQLENTLEAAHKNHQQAMDEQEAKAGDLQKRWDQTKRQLNERKKKVETINEDVLVAMATIEKIQTRNQRLIADGEQKDKLILQSGEALHSEEVKSAELGRQIDALKKEISASKVPVNEERSEERVLSAEIEQLRQQLTVQAQKSEELIRVYESQLKDLQHALNESKILVTRRDAEIRTLKARVEGLEQQRKANEGNADEADKLQREQIAELHQALLAERTYLAEELEKRKQIEAQFNRKEGELLSKITREETQRREVEQKMGQLQKALTELRALPKKEEEKRASLEEALDKKNRIIASLEKRVEARVNNKSDSQRLLMDGRFSVIQNAIVRKKPSVESERLGMLTGGTIVRVTARVAESNWYLIDDSQYGKGYIFGELLLNQLFEKAVRARDRGRNREAAKLFLQVLDQEPWHYQAMMNLALMYAQGQGVSKDASQALSYYKEVAEKSDEEITGEALYTVGIYYMSGWGVEPSMETARHYLKQAAARGLNKARTKLRELGN